MSWKFLDIGDPWCFWTCSLTLKGCNNQQIIWVTWKRGSCFWKPRMRGNSKHAWIDCSFYVVRPLTDCRKVLADVYNIESFVNEDSMWHGSSFTNIVEICKHGFNINLCRDKPKLGKHSAYSCRVCQSLLAPEILNMLNICWNADSLLIQTLWH